MGGGGCIPNAIEYREIAAWAQLTASNPTPWEITALRAMDTAWRAAYSDKTGGGTATRQYQGLGDYCNGAEIDACRKTFGDQLEQVCATCPN